MQLDIQFHTRVTHYQEITCVSSAYRNSYV